MLKIEFDASNKALALAIGQALTTYGGYAEGKPSEAPAPFKPESAEPEAFEPDTSRTFGDQVKEVAKQAEAEPDPIKEMAEQADDVADNDGAPVDEHGTPHNPKYCVGVKAEKPFYASGANKGQWKRGRNVDESAYNEWYESARPELEEDSAPADTSGAFKADTSNAFGNKETAPAPESDIKTAGDLLEWCSELQNAGKLTAEQVQASYPAVGAVVTDLFDASKEAETVAKVYAHLLKQI